MPLSEKDFLLVALERWDPGCSSFEKKAIAQALINCFDKKSTQLMILSSTARTLPDVFSLGGFQHLKILSLIDFHSLGTLPDSLRNLSKLEILDLRNCHLLAELPQDLGNLTALKHLDISGCDSFTRLPTSLGELKSLVVLDLTGCHLIRELPENIGKLSSLKTLRVTSCQALTALPEGIASLRSLERLVLKRCIRLTRLPENFENLTSSLKFLDLADCQSLSGLPNEIVNFQRECNIDLRGCRFSQTILDNLMRTITHEYYNGPRIHFLMQDRSIVTATSLEEVVVVTFKNASLDVVDLSNLSALTESNKLTLINWLRRMSDTADANSAGKEAFYRIIVNYLKLADENPQFREFFLHILQGSTTTCGDRVSLSILHIGIAAKEITCDKSDLKAYEKLLKGIISIDILEDVARNKVPTLRFVDEIEVYLGYPVRLKEALNLPIDIQEMRFFGCSGITQQDLIDAEAFVRATIDNQEAFLAKLVQRDGWKEALRAKYPDQFRLIQNLRDESCEKDDPNYLVIEDVYNQGLIELSKFSLQ